MADAVRQTLDRRTADLLALASIIVVGIVFHAAALGGWWKTDDPQVLLQAMHDSPLQVLFSPHAYRTLSTSSFTPLVTISFDADLSLAGLRPRFFYVHQIVAAILAAIALYFLGRVAVSRTAGWMAATLFLVAPTTVDAVRALMLRHYIEGAIAAAAALTLAFWRPGLWRFALPLSALLYLVATLEKEFYAPLPLFILADSVIRKERWSEALRRQVPYAIAAAGYLGWRMWMLGSAGGYGGLSDPGALQTLPSRLAEALAGNLRPAEIALLACLGLLLLLSLFEVPRAALSMVASATIFVSLPLLYLASDFDPRYAFATMVVLAVMIGAASSISGAATVVSVVLLVFLGLAGWNEARADGLRSRQMVAEGEYVWKQPSTAPTLLAESAGWYLGGLSDIRGETTHSRSPRFVLSLQPMIMGDVDPRSVVASRSDGTFKPLSGQEMNRIAAERARYSPSAPLSVSFARKGSGLRWRVGPPAGRFTFLTLPGFGGFPLPPEGFRRIPEPSRKEWFRVRRDALDGSWTISPPLPLPDEDRSVIWSRP
jgi:hypothetical protein